MLLNGRRAEPPFPSLSLSLSLSLSQYATSLLQMFGVDYTSLVPKMFGVKSTMDPYSNFFELWNIF
jgi:hypothetical protein